MRLADGPAQTTQLADSSRGMDGQLYTDGYL